MALRLDFYFILNITCFFKFLFKNCWFWRFCLTMGRRSVLTDYEKGIIDEMKKNGSSVRQIGLALGRTHNVISKYIQNPGNYGTKKSPGRPKLYTDRQKRILIREITAKNVSVPETQHSLGLPGTRRTALNAIHDCSSLVRQKKLLNQSCPNVTKLRVWNLPRNICPRQPNGKASYSVTRRGLT